MVDNLEYIVEKSLAMDYIVLDLEWNQSCYGKQAEHPRMPFEIIEIGAVKVNSKHKIVDEFKALIKPKLYKKLHKQIKDMLNYDEETLQKEGVPFVNACTDFLKWCGEDCAFCTWGPSDMFYLQENMDFYNMKKLDFPLKYYNIQQIYADKFDKEHSICRLEKAVEAFGIKEDEPFHSAVNDARYTAKIMCHKKFPEFKEKYSIDLYRHPKKKEEEINIFHDGYYEYISSEFSNKQTAMEDKHVNSLICCKCGRKISKKINWFQATQSTSLAAGKCFYHGLMLGKLRFKETKNSDDNVFVIKTIHKTDKKEIASVKERQEQIREKRREKRHESH